MSTETQNRPLPFETSWKELRPIVLMPDDSQLWPGLAVDFALEPLDRKVAVMAKEEEGENEESPGNA